MNIFVVIPVYNRKNITLKCLTDLSNQTYKNFKIILFDDGSSDGTAEEVKNRFPEVILLKGTGNYWWSRSVNYGIEYALKQKAEYILLLNDDVRLPENFISSFVEVSNKNSNALLSAANFDVSTNKILFAGEKRDWVKASIIKNTDLYTEQELNAKIIIESDYLPGRGLWVPVSVFNKIGLFDSDNFPQSAADYDFTIRAKKAGFPLFCCISARVYSDRTDLGAAKFPPVKLKNIISYITSIRSAGCLKIRWKFAIKNCPKYLLPSYLVIDTSRIIIGFILKYFRLKIFFR
ncbi:glycosyltransferase family 2 protein [Candidatus Dependentiae bacterium]|nr:glycosyltransferase family 2 protein [Candidatus Dependentiae bacterium]